MEDQEQYKVRKERISRIEDDSLFQRYSNNLISSVPIDDLKTLLSLFLKRLV